MHNQILAKLVTKYPGLSKTFLGLIAAKMATKVTEESGIDAAILELDNAPISITDLAADFQKEGDRRVSDAEKLWKKKNPPKPAEEKTDDDPADKPKDEDPTAALLKTLLQEVQALKADKVQNTIQQTLSEKLKDVPTYVNWQDWAQPKNDEEATAFIEKVNTRATDMAKQLTDQGLSVLGKPKSGSTTDPKDTKLATKDEVAAIVKEIM